MIEYHSVNDIATLQQHDKVERGSEKTDHLARSSLVAMCTVDNDITFVGVYLPGYLPSATGCRVDCQTINAGVVTPGESLRLVAAGGLIDPVLYTNLPTTRCYDSNILNTHDERPNVGGVSIRSRNGAPSRKGCVVNGKMSKASK